MKDDMIKVMRMVDMALGKPKYTYPMYENAPRPEGAYAAVKYISEENPGIDTVKMSDETGTIVQTARGIRIITYDIMFSRDDVEAVIFDSSFTRPDIKDFMITEGLALLWKQPIDNKNISRETSWEVRTGIRVQFNIIRETSINISTINSANITDVGVNETYTVSL